MRTERLLLRRIVPADLVAYSEIHQDPRTSEFRRRGPSTEQECAANVTAWVADWETDGLGYWTVVLEESGRTIGFGGMRATSDRKRLNLYYRFAPGARGTGHGAR